MCVCERKGQGREGGREGERERYEGDILLLGDKQLPQSGTSTK